MKKFFTIIVAGVALLCAYTAFAGIQPSAGRTAGHSVSRPALSHTVSSSRALSCDTLLNLNLSTIDSQGHIYLWDTPNIGLFSGTGALYGGPGTYFNVTQVGEQYTAPAAGGYVTSATVYLEAITLNPTLADSTLTITAYVYDSTGVSPVGGGYAPGHAIDSATANMASILVNGGARFIFTNQAPLPGRVFFVMVALPQIAGDSLALVTNDGSTNNGHLWYNTAAGGVSLHTLSQGNLESGSFMITTICGLNVTTCPTITVAATQIGTTTSAHATATGGATPYTFTWNTTPGQTNDTASALTVGQTYTVTATDNNGCTGTATVRINPNGITNIPGMTDFNVYPNPSNGVFTASISLESASDVTISVVDMTGNKVYESTDKAAKDITKQINLGSVAAGIYVINVKTANGTTNQRISVK